MKVSAFFACAALFCGVPLWASEQATVIVISKPVANTSDFEYDLTLNDTGTTNIGTLWFGWIPGEDFLHTAPLSETSPAGWNSPPNIVGGGSGDGYSIQWIANSGSALTPGESLPGFSFISADPPSSVDGDSFFHSGVPTETSFVYSGGPFSDPGFRFVAQNVAAPEPASLLLLGLGAAAVFHRRNARRQC